MHEREGKMFEKIMILFLKIQGQLATKDALKQKLFLNLHMVELKLLFIEHGIISRVMHLQN